MVTVRALPLLALVVCGCLDFPAQQACTSSDDCADGKLCKDGACVAQTFRCGFGFAPTDGCGTCVEASCCDQAEACGDDAPCAALMDCVGRCSFDEDPTCITRCESDVAESAAAAALLECLTEGCTPACGPCGLGTSFLAGECGECFETAGGVCEGFKACASDPACFDVMGCATGCDDPACITRCGAMNPTAGVKLTNASIEANFLCGALCDVGYAWDCVDSYSWGGAVAGDTATVALQAEGPNPELVVKSWSVTPCSLLSDECGETVAGVEGVALATVELLREDGFSGFFEIAGEAQNGPLVPTWFHPGHPITGPDFNFVPVIDYASGQAVASLAGTELDVEGSAQMVVTVYDCQLALAPGIELRVEPDGPRAFYTDGFVPVRDQQRTGDRGVALFFNVPAPADGIEFLSIRAFLDGEEVAGTRVRVRAGHLTAVQLVPGSPTAF